MADRDREAVVDAAAKLGGGNASVLALEIDVTNAQSVDAAAARAVSDFGRLDIWINNAGIFPRQDPIEVEESEFRRVIDINVIGTQLGMQAAARQMLACGDGGVILNLASTAGFRGAGAYSASKWAVRGLTHGLGAVLGRSNIRVVAIAPTVTDTPGMVSWRSEAEDSSDLVETVIAAIPLGRIGQPDDVARLAVFLASDAASFITATTVVVDGGSLAAL
jgi:NAD(P)-dependent dehydrogenase (short-subunit alcohol dehydrogenase family)